MNGRGNRSTRRKHAPAPLCPPQIPLDQTRDWSQRLTATAMARPWRDLTYPLRIHADLPQFRSLKTRIKFSGFFKVLFKHFLWRTDNSRPPSWESKTGLRKTGYDNVHGPGDKQQLLSLYACRSAAYEVCVSRTPTLIPSIILETDLHEVLLFVLSLLVASERSAPPPSSCSMRRYCCSMLCNKSVLLRIRKSTIPLFLSALSSATHSPPSFSYGPTDAHNFPRHPFIETYVSVWASGYQQIGRQT
jgi:hypothetical protein